MLLLSGNAASQAQQEAEINQGGDVVVPPVNAFDDVGADELEQLLSLVEQQRQGRLLKGKRDGKGKGGKKSSSSSDSEEEEDDDEDESSSSSGKGKGGSKSSKSSKSSKKSKKGSDDDSDDENGTGAPGEPTVAPGPPTVSPAPTKSPEPTGPTASPSDRPTTEFGPLSSFLSYKTTYRVAPANLSNGLQFSLCGR